MVKAGSNISEAMMCFWIPTPQLCCNEVPATGPTFFMRRNEQEESNFTAGFVMWSWPLTSEHPLWIGLSDWMCWSLTMSRSQFVCPILGHQDFLVHEKVYHSMHLAHKFSACLTPAMLRCAHPSHQTKLHSDKHILSFSHKLVKCLLMWKENAPGRWK